MADFLLLDSTTGDYLLLDSTSGDKLLLEQATSTHTGSGAPSAGAATVSASGAAAHAGSGSPATSAPTVSATGIRNTTASGTGSPSTAAATNTGSGTASHAGSGALSTLAPTASGVGLWGVSTYLAEVTSPSPTCTGSGVLTQPRIREEVRRAPNQGISTVERQRKTLPKLIRRRPDNPKGNPRGY